MLDINSVASYGESGGGGWLCQRIGPVSCLTWQCVYLTHAGLDICKFPDCVQIIIFFFFHFF